MEITEIKLTDEEVKTLEQYYDKMFVIVKDRAVVGMSMQMKDDIIEILNNYGLTKGHCITCNNSLITLFTIACRLYNLNKKDEPESTSEGPEVKTELTVTKSRKTKKK